MHKFVVNRINFLMFVGSSILASASIKDIIYNILEAIADSLSLWISNVAGESITLFQVHLYIISLKYITDAILSLLVY